MKRIFSTLMALVILCTMLMPVAFAEETTTTTSEEENDGRRNGGINIYKNPLQRQGIFYFKEDKGKRMPRKDGT